MRRSSFNSTQRPTPGGRATTTPAQHLIEMRGWRCPDPEARHFVLQRYRSVPHHTESEQFPCERLACYLQRADCAALSKPDFAEEDGGRTHRKVCDDQAVCQFEAIADNFSCGQDWETGSLLGGAESTEDCFAACLADPACTAVRDYFYTQRVPGCYLNTSSCDAPVMSYQDGNLYLKCD